MKERTSKFPVPKKLAAINFPSVCGIANTSRITALEKKAKQIAINKQVTHTQITTNAQCY